MKTILLGQNSLVGRAIQKALQRRCHANESPFGDCLPSTEKLQQRLLEAFPEVIIYTPKHLKASINFEEIEQLCKISNHLSARLYIILESKKTVLKVQKLCQNFASLLCHSEIMGNSQSQTESLHERCFLTLSQGRFLQANQAMKLKSLAAEDLGEMVAKLIETPNLQGNFELSHKEPQSQLEMLESILEHFNLPKKLLKNLKTAKEQNATLANKFKLIALNEKLNLKLLEFKSQLCKLEVPSNYRAWYETISLQPHPKVERLIKGKDF